MKLDDQSKMNLYKQYLTNYQGDDPIVLEYCQKSAVEQLLMSKIIDWKQNLSIIEKSYSLGVVSNFPDFHWTLRSRNILLPLDIAKQIAEHANRYPNYLVALAEAKCREEVASKIIPVAEVAKDEGWFSL